MGLLKKTKNYLFCIKKAIYLLFATLTTLYYQVVYAQAVDIQLGNTDSNGNFFTPVQDDKSLVLLNAVFTNLFPEYGSAIAHQGLENAILMLNTGALTIAGILVAYTAGFGTMQTAHDGQVLGKKWSSMWVPIRYATGLGLMVPVKSYCMAQIIVAWVLVQGVGVADSLWGAYLKTQVSGEAFKPTIATPYVINLGIITLQNEICVRGNNQSINVNSNADGSSKVKDILNQKEYAYRLNKTNSFIGEWGTESNGTSDSCGKIVFNERSVYSGLKPVENSKESNEKIGKTLTDDLKKFNLTEEVISSAHRDAFGKLQAKLKVLANQITPDGDPSNGFATDFFKAINEYPKDVQDYLLAKMSQNGDPMGMMISSMQKDGWLLAGTWFMRAVYVQDILQSAASDIKMPISSRSDQLGGHDHRQLIQNSMRWIALLTPFNNESNGLLGGINGALSSTSKGMEELAFIKTSLNILNLNLKKLNDDIDTKHPIMALKSFGDALLKSAEDGVLRGQSNSGGNSGVLMQIGSTIYAILFSIGSLFGIYIPLLPFLLFITTALGWLILSIEAIIAAPLWAMMKTAPEGEDFMGAAKNGYGLLLGIALRPPLIILGFCAALIVIEPILRFLNAIFFSSASIALMGGMESFAVLVITTGVYIGILHVTIKKTFGLIHEIPDKIPKWMGLGGDSIGAFATSATDESIAQGKEQLGQISSTMTTIGKHNARFGLPSTMGEKSSDNIGAEKGNGEKDSVDTESIKNKLLNVGVKESEISPELIGAARLGVVKEIVVLNSNNRFVKIEHSDKEDFTYVELPGDGDLETPQMIHANSDSGAAAKQSILDFENHRKSYTAPGIITPEKNSEGDSTAKEVDVANERTKGN